MRTTIALLTAVLALCLNAASQPLSGTQPLTWEGDLAARMLDDMDRLLERETAATPRHRGSAWRRDYSSSAAYEKSVTPNRERLRKITGVVDERVPAELIMDATFERPALVAQHPLYRVYAVRWRVLEGVDGEGLLLEPTVGLKAQVVALPDADWTPEMLVGLQPGVAPASQFARRLAENGCRVLVPVLIDRTDTWSGNPRIKFTNQPHREWIYRMAYEMGRHIVGYEIEKVLAAVDWFKRSRPRVPVGVAGYGEGGLIAFYSAAVDTRIQAALVSGYFAPREEMWQEPIYRNVWGLLREFGDAEIAGLIAPRGLIIEASRHPEVAGPPPARDGRRGAAPGRIATPAPAAVRGEFDLARTIYHQLGAPDRTVLTESAEPALRAFVKQLGAGASLQPTGAPPPDRRQNFDPRQRLHHQFDQLVEYTQALVPKSEGTRRKFWAKADSSTVGKWQQTTGWYRRYLWEEVIGKLPDPSEPLTAMSRRIYDQPAYTGYEVVLPVWPDVFAYGILLVPKNMKPGERRPVVVCQHGLDGRPVDIIDPKDEVNSRVYARFGAALAERGFIVYAPQNSYIFARFRQTQRRAHPLKLSLYSFILGQHARTLDWLSGLPFVDPKRIAFYGLSYGGKTAVRVPPLLDKYCLSICSGDFNEWIVKITSVDHAFSYMYYHEYEIMEFDLGTTYNYFEMASLMAPRPFMVERGHNDGVGIDEFVSWEYAKVRRFYAYLGIPERAEIEYFNGPHQIHGVGTYRFLHRWLNWPEPVR